MAPKVLYDQGTSLHATECSGIFLKQENYSVKHLPRAVLAMKKFEEVLRLLESVLPLDATSSTVETALELESKHNSGCYFC